MAAGSASGAANNGPVLVTAAFICIVFVLGGASRADITPLILLRPLSVVVLGYALIQIPSDVLHRHHMVLGLALVVLLVALAQLVPLPPEIWHSLPGREMIVDADRAAGVGATWRPLSLAPDLTWNSVFALLTPLAALLLVLSLSSASSQRISLILLAVGLVSGLLGILQLVGTVGDSLSYYEARNNQNTAAGLFANRNHSAVFLACLFPVLAGVAASARGYRLVIAGAATIVLVPLIIATGSRAGILVGAIGFLLGGVLYVTERARRSSTGRLGRVGKTTVLVVAAIGMAALVGLVALSSHAEAWSRILSSGSANEKRLLAWPIVAQLARDQMPFGSGFGTFDLVFRAGEPLSLLGPTFLNHAHNDWLELWLTGGVSAMLLLVVAVVAYLVATRRVWVRSAELGRASVLARVGSIILLMLALASIVDYPLRTPSLSMFAAIAVAWLAVGQRQPSVMRDR